MRGVENADKFLYRAIIDLFTFYAPRFLHSSFSTFFNFHTLHLQYTPHFPYIFHILHFPPSAFSTLAFSALCIFHTRHLQISTLRIFYTPHSAYSTEPSTDSVLYNSVIKTIICTSCDTESPLQEQIMSAIFISFLLTSLKIQVTLSSVTDRVRTQQNLFMFSTYTNKTHSELVSKQLKSN